MIEGSLLDAARAWQHDDPDPTTIAEIDALIAADDLDGLRDRFAGTLTFGTAGIRGPVGAGPNRMNRVVVRRTAAALARWLIGNGAPGPVVVGRDARHRSDDFAADVAGVLAGAGLDVVTFEHPVPTPLVAFAARHLDAVAAVVVTASHNPPADNGIKVYGPGGRQIVAPVDAEIAALAAAVDSAGSLRVAGDSSVVQPSVVGQSVVDAYLDGVAALRRRPDVAGVAVAYTPMHGVGRDTLVAAFARSGLPAPDVVAAQADPDPEFPTVAFPNPEEPGAMDLVVARAVEIGAPLALANDPDADRLAVAAPGPDGWRRLTGDEVGILLADHLLTHGAGPDRMVATTVVSSSMLGALAAAHGVTCVETLTGFKWLAAAADARPDLAFVLGYEEALGYAVGSLVADKDGISAAVVFTELAGVLAERGATVFDRLDELAATFGVFATDGWTARFEGADGPGRMAAVVDRFRSDPPSALGGTGVIEVEDLASGARLPPTDAVILRGDGLRVVVRPSGTEPKLKVYVEAQVPVAGDVAAARAVARGRIASVMADVEAVVAAG